MDNDTVRKQGHSIPSLIVPYLVLALMLAASVWLWRFWVNAEKIRAQAHFDEYCAKISQDIVGRLDTYRSILQSAAGIFVVSEEVTREAWRLHYEYRQVSSLLPGFHGVAFAEVVAPAELARHVARIRAEGFPEYSVRPDGERPLYAPAVFMEPFDATTRRAFGYDSLSDPTRRGAMERARDTASVTMSGRLRLVVDAADGEVQPGFMLYVPVFASGVPPSDVEARRAAVTGYVHGALRVKDFMRSIFAEPSQKVAFELYDGATVSPETLLFTSRELNGGSGNGHRSRFSRHTPLELYGHTWSLAFRSTPLFDAEKAPYRPWIILITGLTVSILVFLLMRSQQMIVAKAKALAAKLTVDLRKSEQRFEQSTRHGRTFVWETDAEGLYTYVSAAVEDLTGNRPEELVGRKTIYDLHPEEGREAFRAMAAEIIASKKSFSNLENRVQTQSGTIIWVSSNGIPLLDAEGKLIGHRGGDTDITARRQAEDAVRQAKEDWEKTFDAVPDGIMILDLEYRVKQVNRAYAALLGRPQADCLGRTCSELLHGTVEPPPYCPHARMLEDGQPHTVEIREERMGKDLALGVFPLRNSEGSLTGSVHIISDITARKQAEADRIALREAEAIKARERFLAAILQTTVDGFWVVDKQKRIIQVNDAYCAMSGYSREEIFRMTINDFDAVEMPEDTSARMMRILKTGSELFETCHRRKDGTIYPLEISVTYLPEYGGQLICYCRDITERKRAEEQLREHVRELADSNAALMQFNSVAVDRELRMVELKREINALCAAAGQPPRYDLQFAEGTEGP